MEKSFNALGKQQKYVKKILNVSEQSDKAKSNDIKRTLKEQHQKKAN